MEENVVGEKIRKFRKLGGYSQEQFAKALGITTATLSAYETGKTQPGINIVIKIALMFNTSTDYVLDLVEPEIPIPFNTDVLNKQE